MRRAGSSQLCCSLVARLLCAAPGASAHPAAAAGVSAAGVLQQQQQQQQHQQPWAAPDACLLQLARGLSRQPHSGRAHTQQQQQQQPHSRLCARGSCSQQQQRQRQWSAWHAGSNPWLQWSSSTGSSSIHTSSASRAGQQDFYAVLGLSKSASDQDIKKAYYKLAKKYHPDTNKDDPQAARQFQEVSKAYETLRDPEKRRMYDALGREGMDRMEQEGGGGPGAGGWYTAEGFGAGGAGQAWSAEDIFAHFFGGGRGGGGFAGMAGGVGGMGGLGGMGMFMETIVRLSFMEAAKGTHKQIDLSRMLGMNVPPVEVELPPGLNTGQTIQVAAPVPGEKPGQPEQRINLLLRIEVEPHAQFQRHGLDIIYSAKLKLSEALLGTRLTVPTIDGMSEVVVPPVTMNGDTLLMAGKGVQDPRGRGRGDQLVKVRVIKPSRLTARQQELLREFAKEEGS